MVKKKRRKRKGQVYIWFAILVILFTFTLLYNIFTYPFMLVSDNMATMINASDGSQKTTALSMITTINNVWFGWLLLMIFFLAIWGFVASQRREPTYGGY